MTVDVCVDNSVRCTAVPTVPHFRCITDASLEFQSHSKVSYSDCDPQVSFSLSTGCFPTVSFILKLDTLAKILWTKHLFITSINMFFV